MVLGVVEVYAAGACCLCCLLLFRIFLALPLVHLHRLKLWAFFIPGNCDPFAHPKQYKRVYIYTNASTYRSEDKNITDKHDASGILISLHPCGPRSLIDIPSSIPRICRFLR
ncbi:unnamed protein product [Durusdinium trenchii]|uniref:Secreted protein n=1 Tax=Durusdinium trenchii TaxID=1381693 RepID=A0ABP0PWR9_9DINO